MTKFVRQPAVAGLPVGAGLAVLALSALGLGLTIAHGSGDGNQSATEAQPDAGDGVPGASHSDASSPAATRDGSRRDSAHRDDTERVVASAKDLSRAFRLAAEKMLPSVVAIETRSASDATTVFKRSPDGEREPFSELFGENDLAEKFGIPRNAPPRQDNSPGPRPKSRSGLGAGVVFDEAGFILTNHHVVAGAGELTVRLYDGREYLATDTWSDTVSDLAVVKIDGATELVAATFNDDLDVGIGDWVLALGQPFGFESTVTAGIISGKHRGLGLATREDFLQTDAAINPGNSGGPLVDLDGNVIGISTAISTRSGGNDGIGFAVPAAQAKWVGEQLRDNGRVERAFLGVEIQAIDQTLATRFAVRPREGVLVTNVLPDTPAAEAGLRPGDIVAEFAGVPLASTQQLQSSVERSPIGSTQTLTVLRDGDRLEISVTPRSLLSEESSADEQPALDKPRSSPAPLRELGFDIRPLDSSLADRLGIPGVEGVLITDIHDGSPADDAGLERGMAIVEINRISVRNVADVEAALQRGGGEDGLLLLVRSPKGSQYVLVERASR